jgi:hypothetical protein
LRISNNELQELSQAFVYAGAVLPVLRRGGNCHCCASLGTGTGTGTGCCNATAGAGCQASAGFHCEGGDCARRRTGSASARRNKTHADRHQAGSVRQRCQSSHGQSQRPTSGQ